MLKIKIVIILLLFMFVEYFLYSLEHLNLNEHVAHWRQILADEIPIGSSEEQILSWGKQHKVEFIGLTKTRLYAANLESVPVGWPGLPCWEWNVIVDITLGANRLSTEQIVSTVGSCL